MADSPEEIKRLTEEASRLAKELGVTFDEKVNRSVKELNVLIKGFKEEIKKLNSDISSVYDYFRKVTEELRDSNVAANDLKRAYSSLTSIAQSIQQIQLDNKIVNEKDLLALKQKLNVNKGIIEASVETFKRDEALLESMIKAGGLTSQELKLLQYKLRLLKEDRQQTEDRQKHLAEYVTVLQQSLKEEEQSLKRRNYLLGLGGNILTGTEKIMDRLGLSGLKTYANFDDARESMVQMARAIDRGTMSGNRLTILFAGLDKIARGIGKVITDPLAISLKLLDSIFDSDRYTGTLSKEFNVSYLQAVKLRQELNSVANLSGDINITTQELQENLIAIGKALGSNAILNEKDLITFTKLTKQAGYLAGELIEIQKLSLVNGKTLEENTKEILGATVAYASQNKLIINEKDVLREVNKISAALKVTLGGSLDVLARSVVQAKQFGLNLQQAEQIASSLLSFEDSISNEIQAEILTGKQFNFERARALALEGDIAKASAEVAKQFGTSQQFGKLNVIQQEALARSIGLSREQLAQSLIDREALIKLSAKEGETAQIAFNRLVKEVGLEQAKKRLGNEQLANQYAQQSVQERFNATILKLQEIFVSLAQPLLPVLDVFVSLMKPVGMIAGYLGQAVGFVGKIIGSGPGIIATYSLLALVLVPKILSGVGLIGSGLASGLKSMKDLVVSSALFAKNLIFGEGKLGERIKNAFNKSKSSVAESVSEEIKTGSKGSSLESTVSKTEKGSAPLSKKGVSDGFRGNMKNIADGFKFMGQAAVIKGIFNTLVAGPSLVAALPSIPFVLFMGKTDLSKLNPNFKGLASGLKAMGHANVFKGIAALTLFGIASIPALASIPFLTAISIIGVPARTGLRALSTGLKAFGDGLPSVAKGSLALAVFGTALIPLSYALKQVTPFVESLGNIIIGVMQAVPPIVNSVADGFEKLLDNITFEKMGSVAMLGPALLSASVGLTAFSVAMAGSSLASFFSGDGIVSKIEKLSSLAPSINSVSISLSSMANSLDRVSAAINNIDSNKLEVLSDFATKSAISAAAQGIVTSIVAPIQGINSASSNKEMERELREIKNLLSQILHKEGDVLLDGNKVGSVLSTNFSTFKSQ